MNILLLLGGSNFSYVSYIHTPYRMYDGSAKCFNTILVGNIEERCRIRSCLSENYQIACFFTRELKWTIHLTCSIVAVFIYTIFILSNCLAPKAYKATSLGLNWWQIHANPRHPTPNPPQKKKHNQIIVMTVHGNIRLTF